MPDNHLAAATTVPHHTQVPNTAQYDLADWEHNIEHTHAGDVESLDAAKEMAAQRDDVSFFFHMRTGMSLPRNGYFAGGDNVFFSGWPWLGSAPMADTYFAARKYDLDDDTTLKAITATIESIKLEGHSASSTGKKLVGGFVFIDFPDRTGEPGIAGTFQQLITYSDVVFNADSNTTEVTTKTAQEWLAAESKGAFTIDFELHDEGQAGRWIRMAEEWQAYSNDARKLTNELVAKSTLPETWDIVYVVLPQDNTRPSLTSSQSLDCTRNNEAGEFIVIDNKVSAEANGRDWAVVVHETLHALGLPDLYFNNRSYGWSMMADMRVSWHLLGWERMLLGWLDPKDYLWIKGGLVTADLYGADAPAGKCKGVVFVDDDGTAAYVVEPAQATGRTPEQRNGWSDAGVLFYRVELRHGAGQIVPLVKEFAIDNVKGGASKAVYLEKDAATAIPTILNGVFLQVMGAGGAQKEHWTRVYVGRQTGWKPSESTTQLREGEYIESKEENYQLHLTVEGELSLLMKTEFGFVPIKTFIPAGGTARDYGYFCLVERDATVTVSQGAGPENKGEVVCTPGTSKFELGHYFLWLYETPTGCTLAVYSGRGHQDPERLKEYDIVDWDKRTFGGSVSSLTEGDVVYSPDGRYRLALQSDNNLVLNDFNSGKAVFEWSAFSSNPPKGTVTAAFRTDGKFALTAAGQAEPVWVYPTDVTLDAELPKQFSLRVGPDGKVSAYQGASADKEKLLYTLN